jgi:hypothetical protein
MRFWQRFARLNAPLVSEALRELADQVELLWPGPALFVSPPLFTTPEGDTQMGEITVQDDSAPLSATVSFLDAKGAQTVPDDVPAWTSSDEAVATVTAGEDGTSAEVAIGTPGATVIEVRSVEANTGEEIVAQGTITVQAGDTVVGSVEFAPPAEA